MKTVIVLPTYNEKENINKLLTALVKEFTYIEKTTPFQMFVLVVDDNSPDGTSLVVKEYIKKDKRIILLNGKKQGLGKAYIRGFSYAMKKLSADVILEMDADFSHNPKDVKRLLKQILLGADFVIGSRYVKGGTIPEDWSLLRKMNSKFGNIFARFIAGIYNVKDCTAGFRAIRVSLLQKINLSKIKVNGYSFQMNILFASFIAGGKIVEVPVHFIDRQFGNSKIGLADIFEFINNAFYLRLVLINNFLHEIKTKLKLKFFQRASI